MAARLDRTQQSSRAPRRDPPPLKLSLPDLLSLHSPPASGGQQKSSSWTSNWHHRHCFTHTVVPPLRPSPPKWQTQGRPNHIPFSSRPSPERACLGPHRVPRMRRLSCQLTRPRPCTDSNMFAPSSRPILSCQTPGSSSVSTVGPSQSSQKRAHARPSLLSCSTA